MGTVCIITEKPSVARDLARIVGADNKGTGFIEGNGYIVTWAIGHLVTLAMPQQYGIDGVRKEDLPLLPNPFQLIVRQIRKDKEYIDDPAAVKQLSVIKNCFEKSAKIIVATDAGREGELIFRYIFHYLKCNKPFERLWISSLTDKAIKEGLNSLKAGASFDNLYLAGKARSEADWLVGINASRALSIAAGKQGYSLGRVQTPTLSIICKRYIDNKDFKSSTYWKLEATISKEDKSWRAISDDTFESRDIAKSTMQAILSNNTDIDGTGFLTVSEVERKEISSEPPLLYDLTTLQKEANKRHGFSADKTLSLAQSLYEKKIITYPRTGSRFISKDVFEEIPSLLDSIATNTKDADIANTLKGEELYMASVDDSKVTDHQALLVTGNAPQGITSDEQTIYQMIVVRLLESFSQPSKAENITIKLIGNEVPFTLKAKKIIFAGWRAVAQEKEEEDGEVFEQLPTFTKEEKVSILGLIETEHHTKPKPLFTEATLLSAMENAGREVEDDAMRKAMDSSGIGTPATRANIIETLLLREYIKREKKSLVPTDKGLSVYHTVKDKQIANAEMTGEWELALSKIEEGTQEVMQFQDAISKYTGQICNELLQIELPDKEEIELLTCPCCKQQSVRIYSKVAKCTKEGCNFHIFRDVCGKTLSEKDIQRLITRGKTATIKGFVAKSGKKFNAALTLNEEGKTAFEFNNR